MNRFIIISIFIILFSCLTKKETTITVSELKSKSEFLNQIRKSFTKINITDFNNITFTNYDIRFIDTYQEKLKKIQKELKVEDYNFFIEQINEYEKFEKENIEINFKLQNFNYVSKSDVEKLGNSYDRLWKNFRKKYGKKSLLILSKPLISKNSKLAIVEIQVISELENYDMKKLYVFKKTNDNWVLFTEL